MPTRFTLVLASLLLVSPAAAQLTLYETTLILETPVMNDQLIDTVVFRWSTESTTGHIDEADLRDSTMILKSGGVTIYEDAVLIAGVPQPFGGQPRALDSDFFWDYDLDSLTLYQMRNISWDTAQMSAGTQYYVGDGVDLITDGIVDLLRYDDGLEGITHVETLASQSTALMIFFDGFESGNTNAWSASQP